MATTQPQDERFSLTGMHHGTNVYQAYLGKALGIPICMYSVGMHHRVGKVKAYKLLIENGV